MIWNIKSMRSVADRANEKKHQELVTKTENWIEEVVALDILHKAEQGAYYLTYPNIKANYDISTIMRILRDEKEFIIYIGRDGSLTIKWEKA